MSEEAAFDDMGDILFDNLGVDATFIPAAGDPISLKVIHRSELVMQPVGYESRAWQGEQTIEVLIADIGREPNRGEKFEIDDETYTVRAVQASDNRRFCTVSVA
jgi:hypothetical protein